MSEGYVDVTIVSGDEEYGVLMPTVPRVGELVLAPNYDWQPIAVKSVEWQPRSQYASSLDRKWRAVVALDV